MSAAAPAPAQAPIGVFDSGIGGLSVVRELRCELPHESIVYYADTGHCPYGGKSAEELTARAQWITEFLLDHGAKLVVAACNTATIAAIESLRATWPIPFVGMEPAVKPAVAQTRSGTVAVLATGASLSGDKFLHLLARHAGNVRVLTRPCPGWVEQVEAGELEGPRTEALVAAVLDPLLAEGVDTLVLGCTHFPFLRPLIQRHVGPTVSLIDTGAAVARQTRRLLARDGLLNPGAESGGFEWFTSGDTAQVAPLVQRLLAPE